MSIADERRGYDSARAVFEHMSTLHQSLTNAQTRHERFVANRLAADMQERLEAADECIRLLNKANEDLRDEILALHENLDEFEAYCNKCYAVIEARNAEIDRLNKALQHETMIVSLVRKGIIA
jgi:predicted RNase H-like nuclease (RuvC/YqgF family)